MSHNQLPKLGLLDYLSNQYGFEYLSNLHYVDKLQLHGVLEKIPAQSFPLKEWEDAFSYLTGEKHISSKGEEGVKALLLDKLKRK